MPGYEKKKKVGSAAPRLATERRARGLTQLELGELADVAHETISRIEQGRSRPSLTTLQKLAAALGLEASELLRHADESRPVPPVKAPSRELRRLLELLPQLGEAAVRHLLGIARLLKKKQKRGRKQQ